MKLRDLKHYTQKTININNFEFDDFQRVELLLFLINYLEISGEINDYYLILGGRGLISRHVFDNGDYLIQNARILLKTINQKKVYLDELKKYETAEDNSDKLYTREDTKFIKIEDLSVEISEKEELYLQLLSLEISFKETTENYGFQNGKRYGIIVADKAIEITLLKSVQPIKLPRVARKKNAKLKISLKDLIGQAKVIDNILSDNGQDFRQRVIENNTFKKVNAGRLQTLEEIEFSKITNIVGQVGAGKSIFSDIVAKKLADDNRRIVIIEPTVHKVLRKSRDLIQLGIKAVPVIGASDWKKHINRESGGKDFLGNYHSKILTTGCPLGGLINELGTAIEHGQEPCTKIYKFYEKDEKKNQLNKKKRFKCPYYYACPKTKIQAEIPSANVIVTTTAGLSTMKIGISGMTLFQYVLENVDLVIVDEAESELQKIDKIFAPYVHYDDYIMKNGSIGEEYFKKPSNARISSTENDCRMFINLHQQSDMAFNKIQILLENNQQGFHKSSLKKPFTGKMLLRECKDNKKLPDDICKKMEKMIGLQRNRKYKGILQDLVSVKNKNELLENFKDYEWGSVEEISNEQTNMIIFIGAVLYFEACYRSISNLVEGNIDLPSTTKDILSQRFEFHQRYLPVSPTGNIFALQYNEGNGKPDLCIIKQFALGRAMYLRFPWLKLDSKGNPMGPNVMLLSGSSFAPGSFANHISEPVNYIIEAENFKRDFISKSRFEFLDTGISVSGSGDQRDNRLRELVSACKELILEKLQIENNHLLMIVNSYPDAKIVKMALIDMLKDTEYRDHIAELVPDSDNEQSDGKIKQSEISEFIYTGMRIMIAPAIIIERGHNIVDGRGNAAFDTLIFLTRPMARPDDYTSHVGKVNGYIMSKYSAKNYGNDMNVFSQMRKDAQSLYSLLGSHSFNIKNLQSKLKNDIVVTLFVMVLQIFGRLCRIGNQENMKVNAPEVYFADAAFKAGMEGDFDLLNELVDFLDQIMQPENDDHEIAKTLYESFYNAIKKGRHIYGKC